MKLSTKGRYGLRAIVDLAVNQTQGAVSISSIAARQSLSENYLEQLMSRLKKAELVCSVRGAQGGYVLAKAPEEISVGDILRRWRATSRRWLARRFTVWQAIAKVSIPA